jgi:hypothetical protein
MLFIGGRSAESLCREIMICGACRPIFRPWRMLILEKTEVQGGNFMKLPGAASGAAAGR